ncbi:MAG TPA: exodeoxyribonuclease VII large subunit [Candidatus Dormibacteraeota bacterium]|nr:exodeoxyribonuclease VII large subunit [Candidatus Dormibacteraeota bacterium]
MSAQQSSEPRVYSVKDFTARLSRLFAAHKTLSNIAVQGEVSDVHPFGNGHLGFRLKEEQAILECIAWSDKRRELPELKNGMAVIASGSIGVRQDRGCYQLVVEHLEPTGLGALFLLYERLKETFRIEGIFAQERKRAVPELPRRVALVSARGKAMDDFVGTLARRTPFVDVTFVETQVQGLGAEIEIAAAIDNASRLDVDVIVLTRGGGSYEDLFPFNLEPVIRAIVRARHPVLTAIGHSGDRHLADDAADRSFGTPSLVAEHIAQGWVLAQRRVREAERALNRAVQSIVLQAARRAEDVTTRLRYAGERVIAGRRRELSALEMQLDRRSPREIVTARRVRLLTLSGRIETNAVRFVNAAERALERAGARLDRLDPLAPLARGYAIVTHGGKAVRDASLLQPGEKIDARFEHGSASARVERVVRDE